MKISASVYSSKSEDLAGIIKDLDDHGADLLHIDCNDNPTVFNDIARIRQLTNTPVDLHIISPNPSKYFDQIEAQRVEYVTFQWEDLEEELDVPNWINAKVGLAITSDTDIEVFAPYAERFDFILFMATVPGQSGGRFDKSNFKKIRQFRQRFPDKRIHVDGGVNDEVSFILRNMGVYASVSGSYLMDNDKSMGAAMMNLKMQEIDSQFKVRDFMYMLDETPILGPTDRSFGSILKSIEHYDIGFTILIDDDGKLEGIISNADIRKGLLANLNDLNALSVNDIINRTPVVANEEFTVKELLRFVKKQRFPIGYVPVVNSTRKVTGVVTFVNLIKGEL